jgi:hypothetical protein
MHTREGVIPISDPRIAQIFVGAIAVLGKFLAVPTGIDETAWGGLHGRREIEGVTHRAPGTAVAQESVFIFWTTAGTSHISSLAFRIQL